ncbi:MAG: tetraacyldisaccharide 4'-kinase, partial [Vicinamibacterales bacterium]
MLDVLYGQVMRRRRRRVERRPDLQRRLRQPVISVGNLSVGGTGKTPVVAAIAQKLIEAGQRPSILSRGYARTEAADGVVVVSDGARIHATVDRAGDEPLMLARQVPRAVVCVSPDRHLAGTLAEHQLGCTVHILDDGFQHLELARNLDVLVTTIGEIPNGRMLPTGRLREPIDAAARAHFLVVSDATAGAASSEAWNLGISQSCGSLRTLGNPVSLSGRLKPASIGNEKVVAVAGIANPQRFFDGLKAAGWNVVESIVFADHLRFTASDVEAIESIVMAASADVVYNTDKDAVR